MTAPNRFDFRRINCPVCSANDCSLIGFRGGDAHQAGLGVRTSIVRCNVCTHQYPNPMPFPLVSLGELYGGTHDYFERHDIEQKKLSGLELVKKFGHRLGRKGRFLDVGCGRGELLWAANELGWEIAGVDTSPTFVEYARNEFGVDAQVGTLHDAQFAAASFDCVTLTGVIEHVYDPIALIREVHRILQPGGWLYLDAPNEDGLYMTIGNAYMKFLRRNWVVVMAPTFSPFHVQGFNPASLKRLILVNGFEVKDFRVFGEVSPQTGNRHLRKSIEDASARFFNWVGNRLGKGIYMDLWAQKRVG